MRRNFLLMMFAILLLGGCKKDKEVQVVNIVEKNPTVTASVTSVTIREKYGYPSDLKSVTVAYTKNSDYSSASMIPAEIQVDPNNSYYHYYYVKLTNLEPNTKYYYYCIFDTGYGSSEGKQRSFTTLGNGGGGGGGRFGVSPTTTVEFAPGNLYWDGSAFRFEENQWSFASTWNPSHVSHFFWSKTASVAYASSYSDSGASTGDVFFTNGTQTTANPNFQVSGETAGTWRTLSSAEWDYLLYTRDNASSLRAWVTLTDVSVSGLVILPDGSSATASGITTSSALAASGAVFLPASGNRSGTDVNNVGSYGYYWSSSPYEGNEDYAYSMYFYSGNASASIVTRYYGYAVRLVR